MTDLKVKFPNSFVLAGLGLAWLVDWLLYDRPPGLSLLLIAVLLALTLRWLGEREGASPLAANRWLWLPLAFFAVMAAVRAHPVLTALNVLAMLGLGGLILFFHAAGRAAGLGVAGLGLVPVRVLGWSAILAWPMLRQSDAPATLRSGGGRRVAPLVRGGLLALPVLAVFAGLLASADLIFAAYLERLADLALLPALLRQMGRGARSAILGWFVIGGLVLALVWRRRQPGDQGVVERALEALPRHLSLGGTEALTLLALVDLLLLVFVGIQFAYLFGGDAHRRLQGFTYADYARRGFFELVVVAGLALALVLALHWITRPASKRQQHWLQVLSSLLMALVLVVLASAWQRMRLYEVAYGYTQLRLAVLVLMAWLGALLLWQVLTQWTRPHRFGVGLLVCGAGFLATLNLLNPDRLIVQRNLARYAVTGDLDAAYLTTLSADAVPALVAALTQVAADPRPVPMPACVYTWHADGTVDTETCAAPAGVILLDNLRARRQAMLADRGWQSWPAFNLGRWRAFQWLTLVDPTP